MAESPEVWEGTEDCWTDSRKLEDQTRKHSAPEVIVKTKTKAESWVLGL